MRDTAAAIIVLFALMAPILVGAAGMALDYAQAYLVQQRLSQAIDAAALAATAYSSDASEIEAKVQEFFDVNYPPEKLGATFDPEVVVEGNLVTVTGSARYDTFFLTLIGIDDVDVSAETVVQREVKGLEVVLVLDNTGSMATNNNISKLRTATCEFIEILYGTYDSEETTDCLDRYDDFVEPVNEFVKIGLVPYSTSVNVGPYGLGYDDAGGIYDTAFLNNPQDLTFSNDADTDICILEADDGTDVTDYEGPWNMYRWCRDNDDDRGVCNYYQDYFCTAFNSTGSSCQNWVYSPNARGVYRGPNYQCPRAAVLPMTDDMTALKNRVAEMEARGWTFGNIGMAWGWRMLSPDFPFTEGVDWDNNAYRKVVVMMTDGDNVRSSPYGAFGYNNDHSVNSSNVLDDRLESVCQNMEDQDNVTVYTITFEATSGGIDNDTRTLYENCAGNGGSHEHVTTSEELIDVFRAIAQELSNLHIKS
ncbi:MAG: TadE/TadG family type IV pilus assembly protein [Pseudomonadota bacterium]